MSSLFQEKYATKGTEIADIQLSQVINMCLIIFCKVSRFVAIKPNFRNAGLLPDSCDQIHPHSLSGHLWAQGMTEGEDGGGGGAYKYNLDS